MKGGILEMKKTYKLEAVIEGRYVSFNREFDSRNSAMNYIFKYCNSHCLRSPVINDEYQVGNDKHNIEYEIDYFNRFRIARVVR